MPGLINRGIPLQVNFVFLNTLSDSKYHRQKRQALIPGSVPCDPIASLPQRTYATLMQNFAMSIASAAENCNREILRADGLRRVDLFNDTVRGGWCCCSLNLFVGRARCRLENPEKKVYVGLRELTTPSYNLKKLRRSLIKTPQG